MEWIKTSEQLPEDETIVLVFGRGIKWIADVDNGGQSYPDEFTLERTIFADEITYWMPLPQPPEE
ncbi:DUF551 domain-containing protein [Morganella morganii]|uniref:DUF551 domain-containing protein n=1 Tax=Morganella morganii TaxID=582 RepID=UPI00236875FD|nr:DUF551 domain-containing protein [Morganella morganii]